jgi:hypothetical protein
LLVPEIDPSPAKNDEGRNGKDDDLRGFTISEAVVVIATSVDG